MLDKPTDAMELLRMFPLASDVLTSQELRDAKGNWRSLIDQQTNAVKAILKALDATRTPDPVQSEPQWEDGDQMFVDALRYRRLRTLGCAPDTWDGLERGEVLRFTNLDEFVDTDRAEHERNDTRGCKPTRRPGDRMEIAVIRSKSLTPDPVQSDGEVRHSDRCECPECMEGILRELHAAMADVMEFRRISRAPEQRTKADRAIAVWRKVDARLTSLSAPVA